MSMRDEPGFYNPRPIAASREWAREYIQARAVNGPNGCLHWTQYCNKGGYGVAVTPSGQSVLTHRLSYYGFVGETGGLRVLHRCDNRRCVRPEHLFLGTQADNMKDMALKGRKGKLSIEQVPEVTRLRESGLTWREVADALGISMSHACGIYKGYQRKHVTQGAVSSLSVVDGRSRRARR